MPEQLVAHRTALVVDDQQTMRKIIEAYLKQLHFQVRFAEHGAVAMKLATSIKPDLILLDLNLPEISGLEVLDRLKADPRTAGIPVLIVSGEGTQDNILTALKRGARDFIVKPFSADILLRKVHAILASAAVYATAPSSAAAETAGAGESCPVITLLKVNAALAAEEGRVTRELARLAQCKPAAVVIDLRKAGALPTIFFGHLAKAQQETGSGRNFRLITTDAEHLKTLSTSGFIRSFEVCRDWEEAIKNS